MKVARIAFIVVVILLAGLSVAALKGVHRNRIAADRYCQMYRQWVEWDKAHPGGAFGPVASMEARCSDTWLAFLNRKTEWEMPWR